MNHSIRLTMAQALVRFLDAQYLCADGVETKFVRGVMGIFGHGNVVGLGQALEQYADRMPFMQGKNEQEIAHVCVAFAKQMRRRAIYACTASIGPGSLNMVTAAGTASVNRIPVLLLPSDTYADRQPDPVLQQLEHDEDYSVSVNDAFKAVSRYWDRVQRPEQLMSAMLNAMRTLTDPARTGAVTVCIPQDVQGEAYDYPEEFFQKRVWYLDRQPASADAIARAAELLATSKRPVILSGGGVRYSNAGEAVLSLAEDFGIPVAETQAGKGEVCCESGWYLGCAGICGTLAANQIVKQADLVLAVGTKLNDFVTNSKNGFASHARFVAINTSRMDALKLDAESIVADAQEGVEALHHALRARGWHSSWDGEVRTAQTAWQTELARLAALEAPDGGALNQTRVLMEL
ncbi:MAG: thiamine pyrophosphate-binding protein, partial [Butyricicoccus sp.]